MKRLKRPTARQVWEWVADLQLVALWLWGLWEWTIPTLAVSAVLIRLSLALDGMEKRR